MVFYRSKSLIKPTMDMYAAAGKSPSAPRLHELLDASDLVFMNY
jgi:hypothetical protein